MPGSPEVFESATSLNTPETRSSSNNPATTSKFYSLDSKNSTNTFETDTPFKAVVNTTSLLNIPSNSNESSSSIVGGVVVSLVLFIIIVLAATVACGVGFMYQHRRTVKLNSPKKGMSISNVIYDGNNGKQGATIGNGLRINMQIITIQIEVFHPCYCS